MVRQSTLEVFTQSANHASQFSSFLGGFLFIGLSVSSVMDTSEHRRLVFFESLTIFCFISALVTGLMASFLNELRKSDTKTGQMRGRTTTPLFICSLCFFCVLFCSLGTILFFLDVILLVAVKFTKSYVFYSTVAFGSACTLFFLVLAAITIYHAISLHDEDEDDE